MWEKQYDGSIKVCYHNVHSLKDKFEDILADPIFPFADLIIFGETWLEQNETFDLKAVLPAFNNENSYLKNYQVSLNSQGRGKGLAAFFREDKFFVSHIFSDDSLQITVFDSEELCVVSIYRSRAEKYLGILLSSLITASKNCLVIGDLNICSRTAPNHSALKFLRDKGFELQDCQATHFGGGTLDQAWLRTTSVTYLQNTYLYSPVFNCKDHDAILFTYYSPQEEKSMVAKC